MFSSSRPTRAAGIAGLTALSALLVSGSIVSAQGRCGGARAGTPACDTSAIKPPFEPTGWKTVALDHFSMQVADYKREAAYYSALMNWTLRSDDGTQAVLDIGDVGGVVIRGGFQAPPPAPAPTPAPGDSAAGRGGRGGGAARAPRRAVWDSFCWVITPWNAKKVEAELVKRGLNPVADNDGKGFESFHVKDPDGFDVQISNDAHLKARKATKATATHNVPAPFENTA